MAKFDLKKAILENKATFHSSLTEGQFSWFTHDTNQQIGSEEENTLPSVYMFDNKGNKWLEKRYEGYGDFGGKDYYELLAQMNGMANPDRSEGISLAFSGKKGILYPALVVDPNFNYKTHDFTEEAPNDPNQSWYAPEENEDDDYVMSDRDDEYLDEVKIEEALTPLQQYVYDFESDVSGEDFAEEEKENIMNLKTVGDVKKYYADYRGWMDDNSLREMLMDLLMDLSSKFPQLKEDFNEIEKPNTKMKKSEFKDKIKEMVLSEMEKDVDYTDETSGYDFLAEVDAILAEAEKEEEETDTETADAEVETPEGTEDVEVTDTTTTATVDPNVKAVQDALTQAQAAAQTLGDAKLTDQIGNTITFFTRSHVVDKGAVAEGQEEMSVDAAADKVENAVDDKLEATVNALNDEQKEQLRAGLAKLGITATTDPEVIASKIDESLFEAEGDTKTKIANALSNIGGGLMKSLLVPIIPVAIGSMGPGVAAGLAITAGTAGILIALAKALGAEKSMEEGKKEVKEELQNDDMIYDRMMDMDQEQLISSMLSYAEQNPSVTLTDYLNDEFGYESEDELDEGKKKYYKDAEADDAEHIKALEKDMKDDKDSSMKIKEVVFPLWQRIK
jgi:hypothetical protein